MTKPISEETRTLLGEFADTLDARRPTAPMLEPIRLARALVLSEVLHGVGEKAFAAEQDLLAAAPHVRPGQTRGEYAALLRLIAQGAVTVATLDQGDVTVPEPTWCRGHDGLPVNALVDLGHRGPEHRIGGDRQLFVAYLSQYPHGSACAVDLYIEPVSEPDAFDPPGAEGLAAALVEAAGQLRTLALQLAVVRAGEGL
ncbi:DUF6907 domain-containing protein [Streptomyces sp. NPDC048462]|uniref:DUF6907 domain-containing protein n=1 Tax=Streptomyces sp. NPDC048462 TaxID=3365555 RepID=UPI003710D7B0